MTNPAIDPFREAIVTSLRCFVGPEGDITTSRQEHAARLELEQPILTIQVRLCMCVGGRGLQGAFRAAPPHCCLLAGASSVSPACGSPPKFANLPLLLPLRSPPQECEALKQVSMSGWSTRVIYTTWPVAEGPAGMRAALDGICAEAEAAVDAGASFLVLSDRSFGPERAAVPSLLAVGAVHHRLTDVKKRSRVGLIVETGEVRRAPRGTGAHACLRSWQRSLDLAARWSAAGRSASGAALTCTHTA